MKRPFYLTVLGLGAFISGQEAWASQPQERPNIIFFMADDLGWQDTSEPFWKDTTRWNRMYDTPNMERLAKQGVKFTSAYASAVSSPSRVSLMTGMNPARHRVTNWTLHQDQMPDPESPTLEWPEWNVNGIAPEAGHSRTVHATTLPQILSDNGYKTMIVGKAHFGALDTPGADPLNLGFESNVAGHAAGGLASYLGERNFGNDPALSKQSPWAVPDLEEYWGEDIFLTDVLTREACRQIDTALSEHRPFFLYMSHYAVHVPWDKDDRFYQKYLDRGYDPAQAAYSALVESMDKSLGDLMDYITEKGIADNTIIIFMSDNGGLSTHARAGRPDTQNYPLRSGKGSAFEGGTRVPLMISWPGVADTARTIESCVVMHDLMPTILEMAQVKKHKTVQQIDGESIVPALRTNALKTKDKRPLVWHYPNQWEGKADGVRPHSSIRKGDWKLIYFYDTEQVMMFNLHEDIFEIVDHGENPTMEHRRNKMLKRLTRQLKRMDAQVPTRKISGKYCKYPDGSPYRLPKVDRKAVSN